ICQLQRQLLEKLEVATTPEHYQAVRAEAKVVTGELSQLHRKLRDASAGDPHEIIALQDRIAELLKWREGLSAGIGEAHLQRQVRQERQRLHELRRIEIAEELKKLARDLQHAARGGAPAESVVADERAVAEKIASLERKIAATSQKLQQFNQAEQQKKEEIFQLQQQAATQQEALNTKTSGCSAIQIEIAKLETRHEDLDKEMVDELPEEGRSAVYAATEPPPANQGLFSEIQKLKGQLEQIGGIDPQVSAEYQETKQRYDFLTTQGGDLHQAIDDLEEMIESLDATIKEQFDQAFVKISATFTQYFKMLFNGGNATLSLVKEEVPEPGEELTDADGTDGTTDGEDENEDKEEKPTPRSGKPAQKVVTGIDIHATPPGKKLRGIGMLSGGERALTSIALICAIMHNNPSPFVVLDEVDAALDESNSLRFAAIIEKLSHKTQFIVITHNRATMNQAHTLYGVTMGDDGISRLLSINMAEAEQVIEHGGKPKPKA
ncbi:MAG: hypothetical protein V1916_01960, partial [Patescibacteria group bacterium]